MNPLENILKLSIAERLLLLEKIWDSIPVDKISMAAAQMKELERRLLRMSKGEKLIILRGMR